jgi:hypothetical protein
MYEFFIGFLVGAITSKIVSRQNKVKHDAMVQADDVVINTTEPILIPKRKRVFVPGELKNFWGSDS